MKPLRLLMYGFLVSATLAAACAEAYTGSITSSDRSQLGRLSRNGVPQDFAGDESFPGIVNPTVKYYYQTLAISVGADPYIDVSIDTPTGQVFGSAYLTSYRPDSQPTGNLGFDTNWLGDAGGSNFQFDTVHPFEDSGFIDFVATPFSTVYLVVNTTGAGGLGLGDVFRIFAQSFPDSEFDVDGTSLAISLIPEPSTLALLALAPLGWAITRRRRQGAALSV